MPGSVCLDITERVVVSDVANTQRTLASLKELGVQIAIETSAPASPSCRT